MKRWLSLFGIVALAVAVVVVTRPYHCDQRAQRLRAGMTENEVVKIMDQPTKTDDMGTRVLEWSWVQEDLASTVRVDFDDEGKAREITLSAIGRGD